MANSNANFTYALVRREDGLNKYNQYKEYVIKLDGKPVAKMYWNPRPPIEGGPGFRIEYRSFRHGGGTISVQEATKSGTLRAFKESYLDELEFRRRAKKSGDGLFGDEFRARRPQAGHWSFSSNGRGWERVGQR